ncbi:MAG: hypothetical protein H7A26_08075 [Spirochaetales bacterium]|nr:hypothetical protein [Spirochaetales bacterium]
MKNFNRLKEILLSYVSAETLKSEDPYRKILPEFINIICGSNDEIPAFTSGIPGIDQFLETAAEKARGELEKADIGDTLTGPADNDTPGTLWRIFHPEALNITGREKEAEKNLRKKRTVKITRRPDSPVTDPGRELLFTSNILLTLPTEKMQEEGLELAPPLLSRLKGMLSLPQKYWYDHPIPIGIKKENNEILYGLKNLDKAVAFEKNRGTCGKDIKVPVLLSVSVTHPGLDEIALDYLAQELEKGGLPEHLDVFVFGEKDTQDLMENILVPSAVEKGLSDSAGTARGLLGVFGVDGEYGRHYSFLKAIAAMWKLLMNHAVKGVFKIDLDQVFDQETLVSETGKSAFGHLSSPLWGAYGTDWVNREVFLGMIAGSLVNEKDIKKGLFTPDVDYPPAGADNGGRADLKSEDKIFYSRLPQALSTHAEMICRYGEDGAPDGKRECLQRVHVTGGTNGILIEALRRWRPFTPSFFGRAEDQAYILSSFTGGRSEKGTQLAYLHQSGLIMRHDKDAFAAEAIKAAEGGRQTGDYIRMLLFSRYAECLPGGRDSVKERIDPFTGSFVSYLPVTTAVLRMLFKSEEMLESGKNKEAQQFIISAAQRLKNAVLFTETEFEKQLEWERKGWNLYYDILEKLEKENETGKLIRAAADKILSCRIQDCGEGANRW